MKITDIPVTLVGAGSQPADAGGAAPDYLPMPRGMSRYVRPPVPDLEQMTGLGGARAAMVWLRDALQRCGDGGTPQLANLGALDAASRELVNQMLGEGEVSVTTSRGTLETRTQETVLAGVWRTLYLENDGSLVADVLEVADVPHVVRDSRHPDQPVDISAGGAAQEVANALPILVELHARLETCAPNTAAHSINLTLLPLSPTELLFLDARLGQGPVEILSRAYGKCQVLSTLTHNLWWVRYFNSMDTLILNTIEVSDVPDVVRAAPEDLRDSAQRLDEIIAPYWSDVA